MGRLIIGAIFAVFLGAGGSYQVMAAEGALPSTTQPDAELKKLTGRNECATCEGLTTSDVYDVLLIDKGGGLWLLIGSGPAYDTAQDGHNEGKTITATVVGKPVAKTGLDGRAYKEVKVSDIKIDA